MDSALQVPFFLPGGQTLMMDHDFMKRLREGDASLGWTGDPRLGVYFADGCIEIHRLCEDGQVRMVMRSKPHVRFLGTETLRFLAEHDSQSRRGYDVKAEIDAHNAGVEAEQERRDKEHRGEMAERLAWALRKDLGHHYGVTSKEFVPLPEAPWKKDAK